MYKLFMFNNLSQIVCVSWIYISFKVLLSHVMMLIFFSFHSSTSKFSALVCLLLLLTCKWLTIDCPSVAMFPWLLTPIMVKTFQAYLPPKCHRTYSCVHCRAHLANHDELISKVTKLFVYFLFLIFFWYGLENFKWLTPSSWISIFYLRIDLEKWLVVRKNKKKKKRSKVVYSVPLYPWPDYYYDLEISNWYMSFCGINLLSSMEFLWFCIWKVGFFPLVVVVGEWI